MIRAWTVPAEPLRAALARAAIAATLTRVDTEPALNAAITRESFDAVVFDPTTPGMTLDVLTARLREHGCVTPVIVLRDLDTLPDTLVPLLKSLLN